MKTIFSARTRASTWRQLWIWLAEGEKELGIDISDEAIRQMKEHVVMTDEDFKVAAEEERKRRHDVYVPLRLYFGWSLESQYATAPETSFPRLPPTSFSTRNY